MTYDLSSHIGILLKNWDFEYQRLQLAVGEAPYLQKRNGSLPVVLCFSFFILPPQVFTELIVFTEKVY